MQALRELLTQALAQEGSAAPAADGELLEMALSAQGLLDATRLLEGRYHLVITNVPYLARGKQSDALKKYCETHYPEAKNDLANVFLERCLELTLPPLPLGEGRGEGQGVVQIVMPQNWLFLTSYKKQRESLLQRVQWNLLARLGPGAFETISGEVVQAVLLTQTRAQAAAGFLLHGVDASAPKAAQDKAVLLREGAVVAVSQKGQLGNPDARVVLDSHETGLLLSSVASSPNGMHGGDSQRFRMQHWELTLPSNIWKYFQSPVDETILFGGRDSVFYWPDQGNIHINNPNARIQGEASWGRWGIAVRVMRNLPCTIYTGEMFDISCSPITPNDEENLLAIWCFCSSPEYNEAVRRIDQKLNVTNATLVKVPFDLAHWQQVAAERYPHGLPQPYSDDPTQWLFHGHPVPATDPLQVAVARLVGYRWPAEQQAAAAPELQAKSASNAHQTSASSYQNDDVTPPSAAQTPPAMELSAAAHTWIARCAALAGHTDDDGIVCLPSVRGEPAAHERLLKLLIAAWETTEPGSWKPAVLDKLLADADCAGKSLEVWLRDKFFEQHAKRFHHRPFVWHVWDGLKDGFAALVNYHQLDAKNLERLIHTYLGDWIRQQEAATREGVDGAPTRLAAAQDLKRRLELIATGEPPHDIFVRWKSLAQQPIGWNPDLNDGVRLNIRPFMTAEVLRHNKKPKLNITWDKDRGKDVESAPWFGVFGGDRINDHHLTVGEKKAAREAGHG